MTVIQIVFGTLGIVQKIMEHEDDGDTNRIWNTWNRPKISEAWE